MNIHGNKFINIYIYIYIFTFVFKYLDIVSDINGVYKYSIYLNCLFLFYLRIRAIFNMPVQSLFYNKFIVIN